MLLELQDEPLGPFVWSTYRLLLTWVATRREHREQLYDRDEIEAVVHQIARSPGLPPGPEANRPGAALVLLLAGMIEREPEERDLAEAALTVSEWALAVGFTETALAYSGLAAGLGNTSWHAWSAGRLHRRHARVSEAEMWYRVADAAATREKDWRAKVQVLNSRGRLSLDVGRYPDARKLFSRALRLTRRHHVGDREAETHHNLFAVGVAMRDRALADQEILRAISGYGPGHSKLPAAFHDLAAYWMDRGDYENALTVLDALLCHHFKEPSAARLLALGSAARAAGGAERPASFDVLHAEFDHLRSRGPETFVHAQALFLVARGAVSLRRWTLARECLREALASSRRTAQRDTEAAAEQLIEQVELAIASP